jgi:chemotaxis protein methyltransferase CheR
MAKLACAARVVMNDSECVAFLQWALPRLGLRWSGFRKVRAQVCKRIKRRMADLGLERFADYRARLDADPPEWNVLDRCCHVTISRFFRDRGVFEALRMTVLPAIAVRAGREGRPARGWSAGCACGEEPYTLKIIWDFAVRPACPGVDLSIVATDMDEEVLARARAGAYAASSLRELPSDLLAKGLAAAGADFCVRPEQREGVTFLQQDLRTQAPPGPFDLVLCRNLAFTYFAPALQQRVLAAFAERLVANGTLVLGAHERLHDARFIALDSVPQLLARIG